MKAKEYTKMCMNTGELPCEVVEYISQLEICVDEKQARIDALMLEYCPQKMTPEQRKEWEKNQVSTDVNLSKALDKQKPYLTKRKRKLQGDQLAWFNDFWKTFDYKAGKAEAADTWLDLKITEDELPEILQGAEREAQGRPAALQAGRTPKMAQGWLSGRRWEDEPLEIPVRPSKPLDPSAYIVPDDWKKRGFAVDIKQREGETYAQFRERVLQAGG